MKRRGFTLLEVLVVVGLIAILSSLLVMAISHLQTNGKRQQTMMLLVSAQGMYADYDAAMHQHLPSYQDSTITATGSLTDADLPCPQNVTADFFNSSGGNGLPNLSADRNGSAVLYTRDFMSRFLATTNNSTAIGKMSPSSLMRFQQPAAFAPVPYSSGSSYSIGARVYVTNTSVTPNVTNFYTCIQYNPVDPNSGVSSQPPSGYWITSTTYSLINSSLVDNSAPVLLDAWGNPIIFVSGGSLGATPLPAPAPGNYTLNADGSIPIGSGGMVSGSGASAIKIQARSPDGRPFFASAGPDGDFSKGDDNLYSFEK